MTTLFAQGLYCKNVRKTALPDLADLLTYIQYLCSTASGGPKGRALGFLRSCLQHQPTDSFDLMGMLKHDILPSTVSVKGCGMWPVNPADCSASAISANLVIYSQAWPCADFVQPCRCQQVTLPRTCMPDLPTILANHAAQRADIDLVLTPQTCNPAANASASPPFSPSSMHAGAQKDIQEYNTAAADAGICMHIHSVGGP